MKDKFISDEVANRTISDGVTLRAGTDPQMARSQDVAARSDQQPGRDGCHPHLLQDGNHSRHSFVMWLVTGLLALVGVAGAAYWLGRSSALSDRASAPRSPSASENVAETVGSRVPRDRVAGKTWIVTLPGGAKLELVWCPAGKDLEGDEVKGFWMGKTEVTQGQWKSVMGNNPSDFKGDDRPVENVSWNDCKEFVEKCQAKGVKVRLPTEREWEYACRAGSTGDWGKRKDGTEGPLEAMGWYWDNSGKETHPVARKEPNAWGLYDMHGNVWEWCEDADGSRRVNRGGCWVDNSRYCAAGCRSRLSPVIRCFNLGFRLAGFQD